MLCKQVARAAEYARQFQYRDQDWPSNEAGVHATATVAAEAAVGRVVEPGNEVARRWRQGRAGVADAVSAAVVDTAGVGVLSLGLMFTDWNDIDITLTNLL